MTGGRHYLSVKRFKEMAKAPKEKKKNWRRRFGF
jgi:hypothetical protein